MKFKIIITSLFFGILFLFSSAGAGAQCAMCRRAAETNSTQNDNSVGQGLNKGILYLLSVPYVIGGIGLFAWYTERRKKRNAASSANVS